MIKRILFFALCVLLMVAGCAGPGAPQPEPKTDQALNLTVFRSPT